MPKLIYIANVYFDGYVEDVHGRFVRTKPDDEVFTFITNLVRPMGTYLNGRRMYETMAVWEVDPTLAAQSELMADFAHVWQAAERSSTPRRCPQCQPYGRGLSADSTPIRSGI